MHRLVLAVARLLLTLRHPALIVRFVTKLGYLPNPAAPRTYHELMLWRKTVDRNHLFVTLTDKLAAKDYVRGICPELPQAKTLWSGRDPADIPPELLTANVVIKANHGCAMNIFVSGGRPDRAAVIATARGWLKKRYGRRNGEWAYWPIVPTVLIEERLELSGGAIATDIKVHVCAGAICHVWVEDKQARLSHLFDCDGKPLPGRDPDYPRDDQALPVSDRLVDYVRQAAAIAPRIAGDLDHIRIDFLVTGQCLYAGELTVYSAAGYGTWTNPEIMATIERNWRLDRSDYLRRRHRGIAGLYARALSAWCRADARNCRPATSPRQA
ncbi:ATP-grasp fold amidoligase family protein [Mesorhizobium abyssinicae]|uniref:ATP-grasp fold amidoligase family protein n=1 Tax=Mesorhizobium abyssinicae TaxID=1209958 RepID=A0ABU5ASG1_9HYPH|nr:ATP-grasp fold amidoligase family protein [Mesorhizobium abyssinicae]MDX8540249.1 ATP-grasp fold amidoligase family protein [Mesorhizobium abyssinicae]